MEDYKIVDLYWARNEQGIAESDRKYGRILRSLSYSLLSSHEDAEECVNDTYLDAWNAMPTARPTYLGAFLSKITRRISIDRFRADHRQKRGGMGAILEELSDCIPSPDTVERDYENKRLTHTLEAFLAKQDTCKAYTECDCGNQESAYGCLNPVIARNSKSNRQSINRGCNALH